MCEYCKNVKTGDDYNPILSENINLGATGVIYFDVVLTGNESGDPFLSMQYSGEKLFTDGVEKRSKIRYCPMCGEMLREA